MKRRSVEARQGPEHSLNEIASMDKLICLHRRWQPQQAQVQGLGRLMSALPLPASSSLVIVLSLASARLALVLRLLLRPPPPEELEPWARWTC